MFRKSRTLTAILNPPDWWQNLHVTTPSSVEGPMGSSKVSTNFSGFKSFINEGLVGLCWITQRKESEALGSNPPNIRVELWNAQPSSVTYKVINTYI